MAERDSEAVRLELGRAEEAAAQAGVEGTPTFWVGLTEQPLRLLAQGAAPAPIFRSVLNALLGEPAAKAA